MMSVMASPDRAPDDRLHLLAALVVQRRLALGISSKDKAAELCDLSHMPYRNVEAGVRVSATTYAKIETGFRMEPGSCKAVIDGADSIRFTDGSEEISGARIVRPSLENVDAEAKEAITRAAILTTPELTLAQAEALSEKGVEELRKRGILPRSS